MKALLPLTQILQYPSYCCRTVHHLNSNNLQIHHGEVMCLFQFGFVSSVIKLASRLPGLEIPNNNKCFWLLHFFSVHRKHCIEFSYSSPEVSNKGEVCIYVSYKHRHLKSPNCHKSISSYLGLSEICLLLSNLNSWVTQAQHRTVLVSASPFISATSLFISIRHNRKILLGYYWYIFLSMALVNSILLWNQVILNQLYQTILQHKSIAYEYSLPPCTKVMNGKDIG